MKTNVIYLMLVLVYYLRVSCSRLMQILAPRYIFGLPNHSDTKTKQQRVTDLLVSNEITENLTRRLEETGIHIPASFRAELVRRTIKKQYLQLSEWHLNEKVTGSSFAAAQGLNLPKFLQDNAAVDDIVFTPKTVIKRLSGSGGAGVYLYLSDAQIVDMRTLTRLGSLEKLQADLRSYARGGKETGWRVEELVLGPSGEPAHDLKFYCFYGVVGLVLEVRRLPELVYCWWAGDGRLTAVGKYEKQAFEGLGPTSEDYATAIRISSLIAAPFVRIDFLAGADKLYFGEFTPRPGGFHQFNDKTDRRLGQLFIEAEARLERDLINGKRFGVSNDLNPAN